MIKYYFKSLKSKLNELQESKPGTWVFAYNLSQEDVQTLAKIGLSEDYIEDATDLFEVPRIEYESGVHYFFTRYVLSSDKEISSTAPILIAISDQYIFTVTHRKPEFLDDFAHGRKSMVTTQKIKFFLLLVAGIVNNYEKSLMSIRRKLSKYMLSIEDVNESELKELVKLETRLNDYIGALIPTSESLKDMIIRKQTLQLHSDDIEILEDLMLDIEQIIDNAKMVYKTAQNIRSTHEVILGHQLNATMKTLTALTILFAIPTIITGMFGMNTWLPAPQGPLGFFLVFLITATVLFVTSSLFKKNKWL